ncbi:MAG: DUF2505 domain-containing protein [Micropruina sp.]|uniref:DUF2505 domain-containing protein n=1 Tax=Micropruina sp. TaxID=2737536 RepID=UPI0039E417BE
MQIQARNDFAADTLTTHAMLTDPAYLAKVCEASGDLDYRVDGVPEHAAVERTMESPSAVRSLLGDRLTLLQDIRWDAAGADGARTGRLELTVKGMPARAQLSIDLRPGGRGTLVDFTGDFTIKVPLVGRSLESKAVPALTAGFDVQQQVGDDWLAGRR